MKLIISPYAKKLREKDTPHPKNYPFWEELISLLKKDGHEIIQIGVEGEKELVDNCKFGLCTKDLIDLCSTMDAFISVENFFPHFIHYNFADKRYRGSGKRGIVLFGKSDPEIFGYPENINLLKDKKYLRWDQFGPWEATDFVEEAFVKPDRVILELDKLVKK